MIQPDAEARVIVDGPLRELASGIDALYLSGRGRLRPEFEAMLVRAREIADELHGPLPLRLGGVPFGVLPHGWGRYRYLLAGELGRVGFSKSEHLPEVRVQPRAELLHAIGPEATVAGFAGLLQEAIDGLCLSVSRLDVFSDWQGWSLDASHRERFLCRADAVRAYEHAGAFTGFEFGTRTTKTFSARVYDKTADVVRTGADWWPALWGDAYECGQPVHRVELEVGRKGLTEFTIDTPAQAISGAGDLWRYGTGEWLTYRRPTADATRSRWPLAPEWCQVQQASLAHGPVGHERVLLGRRAGSLRRLFPGLAGYLASFAVVVGTEEIEDTLRALDRQLREDEIARHTSFPERVRRRREEMSQR